jgi:hypothetical protein
VTRVSDDSKRGFSLPLRAGDWVEVRSKEEILRTLDENARLEGLPFMPEMFAWCGRRMRVWKRAHKTCDTVNKTGGRRIARAVHLEGSHCDGASHGGCEAACLLFWKEAWLKKVDSPADPSSPARCDEAAVISAAFRAREPEPIYSCQATALPEATTPLRWWDFRQYLEDWTSRNVSLWDLCKGASYVLSYAAIRASWRVGRGSGRLIKLYDRFQAWRGGPPFPRKYGSLPAGQKTPSRPLGLRPGELVQIRTHKEILDTLDANNRNRGMYFDAEEVPYCGKQFRVRSAVTKIIDERSGKMLHFKEQSVILDGVYCKGHYSDRRMFCPRAIFPFWLEAWLERAEPEK